MKTKILAVAVLVLVALGVAASGCTVTSHATQRSTLGTARTGADLVKALESPEPGVVEVETVNSADWAVPRSGLINLKHPAAAELKDGDEPIFIPFHVIKHPTKGTFIIDTGVETAMRTDPSKSAVSALVRGAMGMEKVKVNLSLGEWLAKGNTLDGVFLTHLHADHIMGLPDVAASTPVYSGPGEASATNVLHFLVRGTTDAEFEGKGPINEWAFEADATGTFDGVLDVFGDGSVWALWVPGHTPGSTAYLVRTKTGPVLFTGDACHTRWGWEHHVEPGTYTADGPRSVVSFQKLQQLVQAHPGIEVRFGHQR
jgi:glyoxylase-like metal-dependent hydrolase (beta-lactamase superfamily II)